MTACEHVDQRFWVENDLWHVKCLNIDCQAYWTEPLRNADYLAAVTERGSASNDD